MSAVFVTLEMSHDLISGLVVFELNIKFMSVTNDVQHSDAWPAAILAIKEALSTAV